MSINISTVIEDFWTARAGGEFFPQAYFDRLTLDEAYRIQLALIDRRVAAGERHVGWKVGLTAKTIQEQFGFHEPVFACILEKQPTGHVFGHRINQSRFRDRAMRAPSPRDDPSGYLVLP